jgi:hemoglobin-like flavoprotein
MLTDQEKKLITASFMKVAPIADNTAKRFYDRLFEVAPEVKPLFKEDMHEQGRKLMQTIATVVSSVNRLESILPEVQALGRRHVTYGVSKDQYTILGETLMWTFEQELGADFTSEAREAWTKVYTLLAEYATSNNYDK